MCYLHHLDTKPAFHLNRSRALHSPSPCVPIFWHLMASDQKPAAPTQPEIWRTLKFFGNMPQPILAAEFGRHIGAILYSHATVRPAARTQEKRSHSSAQASQSSLYFPSCSVGSLQSRSEKSCSCHWKCQIENIDGAANLLSHIEISFTLLDMGCGAV